MSASISIIIPTFNGVHKLPVILSALEKQSYPDFEVIIAIDGSTDNTVAYLQGISSVLRFEFTTIYKSNLGRAAIRNAGAKIAKGELLIFLDDDMEPAVDVILKHKIFHKNNSKCVLVGGQKENPAKMKTDIQKYKAYKSNQWSKNPGFCNPASPFLTAAHFSVSKDLFFELGGFNETLTDGEDFVLAVTCQENNTPIYLDPTIQAWHHDYITLKGYTKRLKEYNEAREYICQTLPSTRKFISKLNTGFLKKIIYYLLSGRIAGKIISSGVLKILPTAIRYKIFDVYFTGVSTVYPQLSN